MKFIFHSYSESSTFGRPGLGRSTPHQMAPALLKWSNGDFTDSCEIHISFILWELNIWQTKSWHNYHPPQRQFHRFLLYSESSYLVDQVLADLPPVKWQFHRFLLWQLTFHDSSYFIPTLRAWHLADQVLADLPPFFEWQFHWFLLWQLLFHSYSESLSFGRPGPGISTSPSNSDFTDSCSDSSLCWELNIWQTRSWHRSTSLLNGDFTDSCSDSSTLRTYHLADHVLADLHSPCQMAISQIPVLTTLISFLLWELIIWQTRSWQIYLPIKWQFHRFQLYSESSYLADPLSNGNFMIPVKLILHSYSESSTFGRPGLGRSTPNFTDSCSNLWAQFGRPCIGRSTPCQWQFHRFLLWQLIFHSYSKSLSFGRPGPDRSTPHTMVILQILALTAHYSESSSFGRPGLGRSTPPIKWQFHRFLLWQLPTLRAQYLADQVLAHLNPHIKYCTFIDDCEIIGSHSYSESSTLVVLADLLHLIKWQHRFLLYSESSWFVSPNVFWSHPQW